MILQENTAVFDPFQKGNASSKYWPLVQNNKGLLKCFLADILFKESIRINYGGSKVFGVNWWWCYHSHLAAFFGFSCFMGLFLYLWVFWFLVFLRARFLSIRKERDFPIWKRWWTGHRVNRDSGPRFGVSPLLAEKDSQSKNGRENQFLIF